ncbi:MAG: hypothetical protein Q4D36_06875, partial [Bacteroidales bacterium]|nr:hypothetical protein [Bacteroidales bacterium]
MKTYSKKDFLSNETVKQFIDWLMPKIETNNSFKHEYVNYKTKSKWNCTNIYDAYKKYEWPFYLKGRGVKGKLFDESKVLLDDLSCKLRKSIEQKDNDLCLKTCL